MRASKTWFALLDKAERSVYNGLVCGGGEIGRRAGLRSLWVTPYEFKSRPPHHMYTRKKQCACILLYENARCEAFYCGKLQYCRVIFIVRKRFPYIFHIYFNYIVQALKRILFADSIGSKHCGKNVISCGKNG